MSGNLGLSCPKGGRFYICTGNSTEFIGCCTVDPCAGGTGQCPSDSIAPSTFSSDAYDDIPPQDCASTKGLWYTCKKDTPPFLGCCSSNPCDGGSGCPASNLVGAALSHNQDYRQKFLLYAGQSTAAPTSSPSSTRSSTSSTLVPVPTSSTPPTASAQPQNQSVSTSSSLPSGAIAGIAIGAVIAILAAVAAIFFLRRRKKKRSSGEGSGDLPTTTAFDSTTAYHGSYRDSYNTGPTLAGTPSEIESPRMSGLPKQSHSYYSPETRQSPFLSETQPGHNQWGPENPGRPYNSPFADVAPIHEMEATPMSATSMHTYQTRQPSSQYGSSPPWSYNEQL